MNPRKARSFAGWVMLVGLVVTSILIFSEGVTSAPFINDGGPAFPLIVHPTENSLVSGKIEVLVEAPFEGTKNVVLFVDGRLRGITNIPPYSFAVDTANWSPGKHLLQTKLYLADGQELSSPEIMVRTSAPVELASGYSTPQLSRAPSPVELNLAVETRLAELSECSPVGEQMVSALELIPTHQVALASPPANAEPKKLTTTRKWLMTLTAGPGHSSHPEFARSQEVSLKPEISAAPAPILVASPPPALTADSELAPKLAPNDLLEIKPMAAANLPSPPRIHVVMKGESLWSISRHYKVGLKELASVNHLTNRSLLHIGQALTLPEINLEGNPVGDPGLLVHDGKALLPLRQAVETCGGKIYWEPQGKQITILHEGKIILINLAENNFTLDGQAMDSRAIALRSGRTYASQKLLKQLALLPGQDNLRQASAVTGRLR